MPRKGKAATTTTKAQTTNEGNEAPRPSLTDIMGIHCIHGNHGACDGAANDVRDPCTCTCHSALTQKEKDLAIGTGKPLAVGQRTLGAMLAAANVDVNEAGLPFFHVTGRPEVIRVLSIEPKPEPRDFRGNTIITLVRLKVEDDDGRQYLFDVTSQRLLSQLASMEDGRWMSVSKTGSGYKTMYDVTYAEETKDS